MEYPWSAPENLYFFFLLEDFLMGFDEAVFFLLVVFLPPQPEFFVELLFWDDFWFLLPKLEDFTDEFVALLLGETLTLLKNALDFPALGEGALDLAVKELSSSFLKIELLLLLSAFFR